MATSTTILLLLLLRDSGIRFRPVVWGFAGKTEFRAGAHGYDNEEPTMHALFMAAGPAFKRNFVALPFDNIDVYPLVGRVLGLRDPPANVRPNGTVAGVQQLLSTADKSAAGRPTPGASGRVTGRGTIWATVVALLPVAVSGRRHL